MKVIPSSMPFIQFPSKVFTLSRRVRVVIMEVTVLCGVYFLITEEKTKQNKEKSNRVQLFQAFIFLNELLPGKNSEKLFFNQTNHPGFSAVWGKR